MPGASASDRRLLMQVEIGNLNGVKKLLDGGAAVDGSSALDFRPLISAARAGNTTMIKLLLSKGAKLELPGRYPEGARAIHASISGENLSALVALIEAGADYDARDADGQTPLMMTSMASTAAVMASALLEAGADPMLRNSEGQTALHLAAGLGCIPVLEVILSRSRATLNAIDSKGFTPMSTAALRGKHRSVAFLLAKGASDEAVGVDRTSLVWAADGGHEKMVRMMLKHGVDWVGGLRAIPDSIGVSIQGGKAKMLQMLISVEGEEKQKHWAECPLRSRPALHVAAAWCSLKASHVLLAAGANEAATDREGQRPIDIIAGAQDAHLRDGRREDALRRMLKRGEAFRARSFAWPKYVSVKSAVGAPRTAVRVYRPTEARCFASRSARYAKK
ncbi:unnamed protein product [Scytosiphon promiscuus]